MKTTKFLALVAAISLAACAPKSHDRKSAAPAKKTAEPNNAPVRSAEKSPEKAASSAAPAASAPTAGAPAPAAAPAATPSSAGAEQAQAFDKQLQCTKGWLERFQVKNQAFADAAKQTDETLKAMQVVVDSLGDSSSHHGQVKSNYLALTKAYKALLNEMGETFGCYTYSAKGRQMIITSETFAEEYNQLRARVGKLIGTQHLGPEIHDL